MAEEFKPHIDPHVFVVQCGTVDHVIYSAGGNPHPILLGVFATVTRATGFEGLGVAIGESQDSRPVGMGGFCMTIEQAEDLVEHVRAAIIKARNYEPRTGEN